MGVASVLLIAQRPPWLGNWRGLGDLPVFPYPQAPPRLNLEAEDGYYRGSRTVRNWNWLNFSIEFKLFLIVGFKLRILFILMQDAVADGQHLNLCAHEAAKRICWGANNRFSPYIKTRID